MQRHILTPFLLTATVLVTLPPAARATNDPLAPGAFVNIAADGHLAQACGIPLAFGNSPTDSAAAFLQAYGQLLGVSAADLAPGDESTGPTPLLLVYEATSGAYQFTLVSFHQQRGGLPVFRAGVRMLVRNVPGNPLVWLDSDARDLGNFAPPPVVSTDDAAAFRAVQTHYPQMVNFTDPHLAIFAGIGDEVIQPLVAQVFVADNGLSGTLAAQKRRFVCAAQTGEILYDEDQIQYVDVAGRVRGYATRGYKADECDIEEPAALPYAMVSIQGGNTAFADADGFFTIPHGGVDPVTLESRVRGRYFLTNNQGPGGVFVTYTTVTPPGPADILHPSDLNEYYRASVNAYRHANTARDFILKYHPAYPTIATQTNYPVNVNIDSTCGAMYDVGSISFFRAKGGCNNSAFGSAVHHEYGHHLVEMGGSGHGQYGEGMGDTLSMLITDDRAFGYGLFVQKCDQPVRDPVLTPRWYPCSGSPFDCGMVLSGSVWETRLRLKENFPDTYREVLGRLGINAVPLHRGTTIDPNITVHYLVLDDDDQNLANGTPHSLEICGGFGTRNMTGGTPCETMRHIRIADSNCDGKRNFGDIAPFVLALSDLNEYRRQFPNCYVENSDCNKDGSLDFGDINPFVEALGREY